MLTELHEALRELIYLEGRIERSEVDIAFEPPSKDYIDKLVRPTIDFYLVDMQENVELRHAQLHAGRTNGLGQLRAMPKRLDLRYLVTALAANGEDSYRLLWRTAAALIRTPEFPIALLPDDMQLDLPIVTQVAQSDSGVKLLDVWSAVGTEPRASFSFVVTVPVDLEMHFEAPLVLTTTLGFKSVVDDRTPETRTFIRGVLRDAAGVPVNNATVATVGDNAPWTRTSRDGVFILRTPHLGKISLRVTPTDGSPQTFELEVPADSYDIRMAESPPPAASAAPSSSSRGGGRRSLNVTERPDPRR